MNSSLSVTDSTHPSFDAEKGRAQMHSRCFRNGGRATDGFVNPHITAFAVVGQFDGEEARARRARTAPTIPTSSTRIGSTIDGPPPATNQNSPSTATTTAGQNALSMKQPPRVRPLWHGLSRGCPIVARGTRKGEIQTDP